MQQSKKIKLCLLLNHIQNLIKNKENLLIFSSFFSILHCKNDNTLRKVRNISILSLEDLSKKLTFFIKVLKRFITNEKLKKKIFGFIEIQNYYPVWTHKKVFKTGLNKLFNLMQKLIFIKKYICFYEIKEEVYIRYKKIEFFSNLVEDFIMKSQFLAVRSSFITLKSESQGKILCFCNILLKVFEKSYIRSSFDQIVTYNMNFQKFFYLRGTFTRNLFQKIYFKRLSSCLM